MRWWWSIAWLAAGCDQIFGLQHTRLAEIDAQQFDAPADAPYACPAIGAAPPIYTPQAALAVNQACRQYTTSASGNRAVAICFDPADGSAEDVFEIVPGDTQLVRAQGILRHTGAGMNSYVDEPVLSPDGNTVWVRFSDYNSMGSTLEASSFTRGSDGMWTHAMDMPLASVTQLSTLAPTATGYRFLVADNVAQTLREVTVDGAGAPVASAPLTIGFEVRQVSMMTLAPDGQRLLVHSVMSGSAGTYYADRPEGGDFGAAQVVGGIPTLAGDPFMTADCARVYYSASSTIVYVVQQ